MLCQLVKQPPTELGQTPGTHRANHMTQKYPQKHGMLHRIKKGSN